MKKRIYVALIILILAPNHSFANDLIKQIHESHISSNLPETFEKFQKILDRDLKNYFQQRHKKSVDVSYELLRKGPTQSGVAYPKFYAWVEVTEKDSTIESGAVRVTSIDQIRIEITNFISQIEINTNPLILESVFPKSLCDGIRNKARKE